MRWADGPDEQKEADRIREVYARRDSRQSAVYSYFDEANLFMIQGRQREVLRALEANNCADAKDKRILDIGCGSGGLLLDFIQYGAAPNNLSGIDLVEGRINAARKRHPHIDFRCLNASRLPWRDGYFDIISQFTVFTSILDTQTKKDIAAEMMRVLKHDGTIIWYDFHVNNPANSDVRGIKQHEINMLFPGCRIALKRVTLAPPLTRMLAPFSWLLCHLLEKCVIFNTHYLGIIKKA